MERLPSAATDYSVARTYLESILDLPWNQASQDLLDIPETRRMLDEDHFGLKEVKERILEQLGVLKLNPKAKAPILCFVGPPGVGKTSLGQAIARAMGRKFERMSLGGVHDEAGSCVGIAARISVATMPVLNYSGHPPRRREQSGFDAG